jgi:hypothetical protein
MRSSLSNPIEAGVDSFAKMTGAFDAMDLTQQRKTLMAQEEADRKLKNEKETAEFAHEQKTWADIEDEKNGNRDINTLIAATSKLKEAKDQDAPLNPAVDLDEDTQNAYLRAHHDRMGNASSAEIADQLEWQRYVASQVQGKKGILKFEGDRGDKFEKIYKIPRKNIETDSHGNVFKNSKISGALVDGTSPDMPSAPMVTREITPGAYKHIGDKTPTFVAPEGDDSKMAEKGNIDLNARPVVKNKDGSISTVLSKSFEQDGKEVLIPFVSQDGKIMTRDEAVKAWNNSKTKEKPYGDNLGVFNNIADADDYARKLHSSKIWQADLDYYGKSTQEEPLKHGGGNDPNAPLVIHPALFWHSKAQAAKDIADVNEQLQAKWGGTKYRERKEAALRASSENKAISEAYKTSNGDLAKFMETVLDKYPEMSRTDAKAAFDTYAKTKPKLTSKAGNEMTDEAALVAQYGEDSPEVKEFRKRAQGSEPGANKTIYGPGGQTKEVFIDKGKEYVPPKGWSLKAPKEIDPTAHQSRIDTEVDKVEKYFAEHYDSDAKNVDELDLDDDAKKELTNRVKQAEDYVRKGKGSANEAYHKFGAEKTKSALKPITKKVKEAIANKFKDMPNGPAKVKKMEEESKRRGYDSSKTEY